MNTPPSVPNTSNLRAPRIDIPDHTNYKPEQTMLQLRQRFGDLMRLGAATPETFQQALHQMWNETERRRQSCLHEAEEHLRKYHALVSQSHGFSSMASIMWSVINGYVELEERRLQELADREKEKRENEQDRPEPAAAAASESPPSSEEPAPAPPQVEEKNGKHKKRQ